MQDHYQMMLSDYSSDYYGDIKTLFEFTKLYPGEDDYQKWIMFRELDINNMFEDLDEVKSSVKSWARKQAPEYFQTGFDAWVQRSRKCIERHVDYVE